MCNFIKKLFERDSKNDNLEEYYLEDLYVGKLGIVKNANEENMVQWTQLNINSWIAFKKCDSDYKHYPNAYGVDILSNSEYYLFGNYMGRFNLGDVYLNNYIPLSTLVTDEERSKGYILKSRVIDIIYNLNNPNKIKKSHEVDDKSVSDPVLNVILETSKKIKNSNILENDKTYLYEMLSELGKFYTVKLIEIRCSDFEVKLSNESPIDSLRLDVIGRLNVIESEINKAIITGNINKEFFNFDEVLKRSLVR